MADNESISAVRSREREDAGLKKDSQCQGEQHQELSSHQNTQKCDNMEAKYKEDVIPDGGYGWVCVACVFWINAHTWGINSVSLSAGIATV